VERLRTGRDTDTVRYLLIVTGGRRPGEQSAISARPSVRLEYSLTFRGPPLLSLATSRIRPPIRPADQSRRIPLRVYILIHFHRGRSPKPKKRVIKVLIQFRIRDRCIGNAARSELEQLEDFFV